MKVYELSVLSTSILPKGEPPTFIELLNNVEVVTGSAMTISGRLYPGYPTPQIYWKHEDQLVYHHYHWDTITQKITLFVENADQSAGGNYTCYAKNSEGEATSTAFCRILPPPIKPTPPTIYVPLKNKVSKGKNVTHIMFLSIGLFMTYDQAILL